LTQVNISKLQLRNYLAKRYGQILSKKICDLFDISKHWSYNMYCKALETMTHMTNDQFKRIAFDIMDYNSDGFISEIDLFTYMGTTETMFFTKVMYEDFKVINKALIAKKIRIGNDNAKVHINKLKTKIMKQMKDDRLSSIRQISQHMEVNKKNEQSDGNLIINNFLQHQLIIQMFSNIQRITHQILTKI
jgi:hypothetical protein